MCAVHVHDDDPIRLSVPLPGFCYSRSAVQVPGPARRARTESISVETRVVGEEERPAEEGSHSQSGLLGEAIRPSRLPTGIVRGAGGMLHVSEDHRSASYHGPWRLFLEAVISHRTPAAESDPITRPGGDCPWRGRVSSSAVLALAPQWHHASSTVAPP